MGKSQKLNIPDDADEAKINEQVRDILTDIYDLVLEWIKVNKEKELS